MNKLAVYAMTLLMMSVMVSSCALMRKGKRKKQKDDTVTAIVRDTAAAQAPQPGNQPITDKAADATLITELTPLWNKRISYRTFSGKAKVSFNGPDNSADFSANFRIAKDSLVWIHVTALGGLYPVARMLVTRDSFFMVDYTQKEITMLPLADVGKVLPVPVRLTHLQNLLVGDPVAGGNITAAERKTDVWSLRTEDTTFIQTLAYKIADSAMITGDLLTRKADGPHALLAYSNYGLVNNRKLSANRTVHIQNGLKNYNLDMDIINPEFDKELEYPFSLPKNYKVKVR